VEERNKQKRFAQMRLSPRLHGSPVPDKNHGAIVGAGATGARCRFGIAAGPRSRGQAEHRGKLERGGFQRATGRATDRGTSWTHRHHGSATVQHRHRRCQHHRESCCNRGKMANGSGHSGYGVERKRQRERSMRDDDTMADDD